MKKLLKLKKVAYSLKLNKLKKIKNILVLLPVLILMELSLNSVTILKEF